MATELTKRERRRRLYVLVALGLIVMMLLSSLVLTIR